MKRARFTNEGRFMFLYTDYFEYVLIKINEGNLTNSIRISVVKDYLNFKAGTSIKILADDDMNPIKMSINGVSYILDEDSEREGFTKVYEPKDKYLVASFAMAMVLDDILSFLILDSQSLVISASTVSVVDNGADFVTLKHMLFDRDTLLSDTDYTYVFDVDTDTKSYCMSKHWGPNDDNNRRVTYKYYKFEASHPMKDTTCVDIMHRVCEEDEYEEFRKLNREKLDKLK